MSGVWAGAIAPWSPDAEDLIRGALRHTFTVSIFPESNETPYVYLPVTVTACSLTYDEFWSPYVQGELTAEIPDAATLALLDPRLLIRIDVSAGYILPGGVRDVHLMAKCYLSATSIDYPANELHLAFQGPEYVLDRWVAPTEGASPAALGAWDSTTRAGDAIFDCLGAVDMFNLLPTAEVAFEEYIAAASGWIDPGNPWQGQAGDDALGMAREIADRIDAWFRCDDLGVFRLDERLWLAADTAHYLRIGADGTIISSTQGTSREGWANRAQVAYRWSVLTTAGGVSTAVDKSANGTAELTGTPYDPATVGAVTVTADRPWPSTTTQARNAAKALLRRHSVRATTLSLSAVAAYWLRPPAGVRVDLPVGSQLDLNVSAITFDLVTGRMDIRTRNPEPGNVQAL